MKKFLFISLFLFAPISSFATENIKTEAIESLQNAQSLVEKGSYNKAVEEIQYSLSKINELTAQGLLEFIPPAPDGFTLTEKNSRGIGQGVAVLGNAGAEATYTGSDGGTITLNIAVGGVVGQMGSLAAFGSMFTGVGQQAGITSVRINGYTGTLQYDNQQNTGSLIIQVGNKSSINIQGNNIHDTEILKTLANQIDISGLEANY